MPESDAAPMFSARVVGSVQGVGFRAWTQHKALLLGLTGYVHNLADGSVEVIASGDRSALDEMLILLDTGPPAGTVTSVYVEWLDESDPSPGVAPGAPVFRIRY
ncbi:MAG: acylphosphatase [Dehalococcoidia bacterium]|jgi:acylphosphatase|nr:acylphosphatase [Dehalococcoidia bacterium]